jgi:hypothetical protein
MIFPAPIATTGGGTLPPSIYDVPGALRALQLVRPKDRTPAWREAWQSLWAASETGLTEDVQRAASRVEAMLKANKWLAD